MGWPSGISSRDGWKDELNKSSSRSKSLLRLKVAEFTEEVHVVMLLVKMNILCTGTSSVMVVSKPYQRSSHDEDQEYNFLVAELIFNLWNPGSSLMVASIFPPTKDKKVVVILAAKAKRKKGERTDSKGEDKCSRRFLQSKAKAHTYLSQITHSSTS